VKFFSKKLQKRHLFGKRRHPETLIVNKMIRTGASKAKNRKRSLSGFSLVVNPGRDMVRD
jgi:hypothetical protein